MVTYVLPITLIIGPAMVIILIEHVVQSLLIPCLFGIYSWSHTYSHSTQRYVSGKDR